jgi:hypothetical protein
VLFHVHFQDFEPLVAAGVRHDGAEAALFGFCKCGDHGQIRNPLDFERAKSLANSF